MNTFQKRKLPKGGSIIVAFLAFVVDQLSKFWVMETIGPGEIVDIIPCLNFALVFNPGVTFGWLRAYSNFHYMLLVSVVCIMSVVVIIWWVRAENLIQRFATAMILAGALGNLVDRIRFRAVVDFIDFHIFGWHWYTFNLADSAIVLGVGLLLLDNFYKPKNTFV
jgi:signal peptidase II